MRSVCGACAPDWIPAYAGMTTKGGEIPAYAGMTGRRERARVAEEDGGHDNAMAPRF